MVESKGAWADHDQFMTDTMHTISIDTCALKKKKKEEKDIQYKLKEVMAITIGLNDCGTV